MKVQSPKSKVQRRRSADIGHETLDIGLLAREAAGLLLCVGALLLALIVI